MKKMISRYKYLKPSKKKMLKRELLQVYGFKVPKDWLFLESSEDRIWLLNQEMFEFTKEKERILRIETLGVYFCFYDTNRLRLSPEGAQIVGKTATKNVVDIPEKLSEELIRGFDVDFKTNCDAEYVILRIKKGIIGVGKNHKTKILCQFKKQRRIRNLN